MTSGHMDRRTIKDRRIVEPMKRGDLGRRGADSLVLRVLPPEERAAQVERIYDLIPYSKRQCLGITYEMVRAVLDALRDN